MDLLQFSLKTSNNSARKKNDLTPLKAESFDKRFGLELITKKAERYSKFLDPNEKTTE